MATTDTLAPATIVTHVAPDVDALVGVWILRRFGGMSDAELAFVPVGRKLDRPGAIHVDTGLVQFDHHDRSENTCSAQLVYREVFSKRGDPAVRAIVDYALETDWYRLPAEYRESFDLNAVIAGLNRTYPDSPQTVAQHAFVFLDALYENLRLTLDAEREYASGTEFDSIYGKAFAINSGAPGVRDLAHRRGARVVVFVDPVRGFRGFKARSQDGIDFSPIYQIVHDREPDADWFLHSSKELLLCGSPKAPDRRLSQLSLAALMGLIR